MFWLALFWILDKLAGTAVGALAKKASVWIFGEAPGEIRRATDRAIEEARQRFHDRYGDEYGEEGRTFIDRKTNERKLLRSTFPRNSISLEPSDLDTRGFNGSPETDGSTRLSEPVTVDRRVKEVELRGTYPNPARSRATIRYALPETRDVTLRLYDMLGRQVRSIVSARQVGRHEASLDVGRLPSGTYFLRLKAGDQIRTQKLTIVR